MQSLNQSTATHTTIYETMVFFALAFIRIQRMYNSYSYDDDVPKCQRKRKIKKTH